LRLPACGKGLPLKDARVFLTMSIVYRAVFCVLWPCIRQLLPSEAMVRRPRFTAR